MVTKLRRHCQSVVDLQADAGNLSIESSFTYTGKGRVTANVRIKLRISQNRKCSKIAYSARNSAGSLRLKALEFAAFVIRVWENTNISTLKITVTEAVCTWRCCWFCRQNAHLKNRVFCSKFCWAECAKPMGVFIGVSKTRSTLLLTWQKS